MGHQKMKMRQTLALKMKVVTVMRKMVIRTMKLISLVDKAVP
jgi:hypothetical protein